MTAASGTGSAAPTRRRWRDTLAANSGVASIAAFFAVVCLLFSLVTDTFLTNANLLNILRQSAPLLIVATAMTFVITTGGIDLSVGSTLALIGALTATLMQPTHGSRLRPSFR